MCIIDHLTVGGAQKLLVTMASRHGGIAWRVLDLRGSETLVSSQLEHAGIEIERIHMRRLASPRSWIRFFRRLRGAAEPVVHIHLSHALIMGAPVAKLLGKKVVVTLHTIFIPQDDRLRHSIVQALETFCLKHFTDGVIAVGDTVLASQRRRLNPKKACHILPNVVAPPPRMTAETRNRVRRDLGAGDGDVVILSTSRLDPEKDPMTLIAAFAQLRETEPRAVLWLAGDGLLRHRVEEAVDCLQLRDCVKLLGLRADVPALIKSSDIFVLSSAQEGLPLGLVEAMGLEVPVVATRVGDVPSLVGTDCGVLVPPEDPVRLAAALSELVADPVRRREMGQNGAVAVAPLFDVAGWQHALRSVYRGVLGEADRGDA